MTTPIRRSGYTPVGIKRVNCVRCVIENRDPPERAFHDVPLAIPPLADGFSQGITFVAVCEEHYVEATNLVCAFYDMPFRETASG